MLKKPSLLCATCSGLSAPFAPPSSSTSSQCRSRRVRTGEHGYASVAEGSHSDGKRPGRRKDAEHVWPTAPKGHRHPTPYQIFALKQDAPYIKARFYELVKIYHPDLNGEAGRHLSQAEKLERYRLVVAAHAILSDPVRRRAYDRLGSGWNGGSDVKSAAWWQQSSPSQSSGPFSHNWDSPDSRIWRNATWEDWERYHINRARESGTYSGPDKRPPVYMANSYFLAVVVAIAIFGSSLNYGRAQDMGTYWVDQRDIVHDRTTRDLRRARKESSSLSSHRDRVDLFVRQREATINLSEDEYGTLREERANRIIPRGENCNSDEVEHGDG